MGICCCCYRSSVPSTLLPVVLGRVRPGGIRRCAPGQTDSRHDMDGILLLLLPQLSPIHVIETGGRPAPADGQAAGTGTEGGAGTGTTDVRRGPP